ncbi:hypothetical protein [Mycobacterium tuberculosis]|uniref:hypothetical protein n=1 Tax=Mycobacterium tuberculosis TaxID=1773 RepID=UPI00099ED69C|nr:hypothetical protein [Mycobacterium tuberculosis]
MRARSDAGGQSVKSRTSNRSRSSRRSRVRSSISALVDNPQAPPRELPVLCGWPVVRVEPVCEFVPEPVCGQAEVLGEPAAAHRVTSARRSPSTTVCSRSQKASAVVISSVSSVARVRRASVSSVDATTA